MLIQNSGANDKELPFNVRLIEANTNPCIEEPNTLLRSYVPRMIDDMLKIVLDPLFGTQVAADQKISYPV